MKRIYNNFKSNSLKVLETGHNGYIGKMKTLKERKAGCPDMYV